MSSYWIQPGAGNVGSYLISASPFLTGGLVYGNLANGGEVQINFPSITRSLSVLNMSTPSLLISFASRTNPDVIANHHYSSLINQGDSWSYGIRCTSVFVSLTGSGNVTGSFELVAEVTSINAHELSVLSGSGINSI